MQTSEKGIQLIKKNEGYVAHVYNDNGRQAIGYGHDLLPGEEFPNGISQDEADLLLRKDLASRYEPTINEHIPPTCTQNQFDALADFCYNLGTGALVTMLKHGWDQVPVQVPRWDNVNHVPNDALLERRQNEVELFNTPD